MIFAEDHTDMAEPETLSWRHSVNVGIVFVALGLMPLLSHAGGLGLAPLAAIVGGVGLLTCAPSKVGLIPGWVWALVLLLVWGNISALWSPYETDDILTNPIKLGIGVILFLGCILSFKSAALKNRELLTHMFIAVTVFSAGLLIIDILSGYALTFLVDPPREGENVIRKGGDAEMNLGHAITVLVLLMPGVMMMIKRSHKMGWFAGLLFALLVILTAYLGQLMVGVLATVAALAAMAVARRDAIRVIRWLTWIAVFSILAAPIVGYLFGFASPEFKARIPFSWEHRVEMWSYTARQILEAPIWGHGFDAVRTFDATFSSRGIENWAVVSLHPHNAGLHIWAETGLIGAALASITIMMMGVAAEKFVLGSKERGIAVAGFIAAATVVCAITYGVWQDWWWAALFITAATLTLIAKEA